MPSTSHVLEEARDLLKKRLAELDSERQRLERALSELGGKASGKVTAGRRGRPPKRAGGASKAAPRRRRRRSNTRSDQAVKLVEKNPGITASEIAKSMKIKPNYLYRVMADLEKDKKVTKEGRTYAPVS